MDTDPASPVVRLIQAHFPILPVPSLPQLRLHKAGPRSGLWRLAEMDEQGFGPPYWAHYWGGGLALARYILDHPAAVAGRRVLDLGAGSGIVGIAAAKAGAREVIAADIDRYDEIATGLNAAANGVTVSTRLGDILDDPPPSVDTVLVGDLFYERALAERATAFLDSCLRLRIDVLVGDPWRAHLPRARLALVAEYPVLDFGNAAPQAAAVFSFVPPARHDGGT